MAVLLKTASVRVSFIQIMHVRVQNKGKRVWKIRYVGDVSACWFKCFPLLTQVHHSTLSLLYLILFYSILQAIIEMFQTPQDHPWQGGQGQI